MAKKRSQTSPRKRAKKPITPPTPSPPPAAPRGGAVTAERAARLFKLLQLLGSGSQTRDALTRHLKLDVRGFYRDLEVLRAAGIPVELRERRYVLDEAVGKAVVRLPFPDPRLSLGEAQLLAKGRTAAHRKLKEQLEAITE